MKIYQLNVSNIEQSCFELWFSAMSEERKQSVSQMKNEQKRKLRIAADALCRKAVAEFCGVEQSEIVFEHTEKGKPYAKNLPVHFSISHSGDIVICAVSDCEIGIDVEKIRSINPRTAERFATESEKEHIAKSENGFFEIWTLKEAYFKCIGTGLGSDIKDVSFNIDNGCIACSEKGFHFFFYETEKNYICSVCKKSAHI